MAQRCASLAPVLELPTEVGLVAGLKSVRGGPNAHERQAHYEVTIGEGGSGDVRFGWCDALFKPCRDGRAGNDKHSWGVDSRWKTTIIKTRNGASHGKRAMSSGAWPISMRKHSASRSTASPWASRRGYRLRRRPLPALAADRCGFTCNFGEDPQKPLAHLPDARCRAGRARPARVVLALMSEGECRRNPDSGASSRASSIGAPQSAPHQTSITGLTRSM